MPRRCFESTIVMKTVAAAFFSLGFFDGKCNCHEFQSSISVFVSCCCLNDAQNTYFVYSTEGIIYWPRNWQHKMTDILL
jgi:hypothetical protein